MKILITTGVYPPEIGGPATYTKMVEERLPARGLLVSVLPFSSVRHLPKVVRHIAYFAKCLSYGRDADVIFALDPVSVGLPAAFAARLLRKKFFLRLGGDYAWEQGRLRFGVHESLEIFACTPGRHHLVVRLFRLVEACVAKKAERVAVQSAFMKKIVTCWGVPEEKISVIPNGFDAAAVSVDRQSAQDARILSGTVAVSAARLVPWKGMKELIEAVPEIIKSVPDFVLYIIGDGPDEPKLREMVAGGRLTQKVLFTGRLEKDELMRYLRAADVFVLNTEYEGFSNQLLEAMASGAPIVTTDIEGNKGVVDDGENGLLVAPGDRTALAAAVLKILKDKTLAKKLVDGGREKLQGFSVERVVHATATFLS